MKIKSLKISFLIICLIIPAALFTHCGNDDMAIVTIKLERNDLAAMQPIKPKPLIDRILEFFSTPAHAGGWQYSWSELRLSISGPDMDTISRPIPSGTTQYSIEVPAGLNRQFTITAFYDTWGYDVFGGQKTIDITAGQEIDIIIKMIPKTAIYNAIGSVQLTVTWEAISGPYNFSRYIIYRSTNINGPYNEIARISDYTTGSYNDSNVSGGITYYYRIAIESDADGMGLPSDPVSGSLMF